VSPLTKHEKAKSGTKRMKKSFTEIWNNCLAVIKDNIPVQSYKSWFEPIKAVGLKDNMLTLQVPSQFFYEFIEEHYIALLKKTVKKELGPEGRLEYNIVMDSSYGHNNLITVKAPMTNKKAVKNPSVAFPVDINKGDSREIPNPFVIPGLRKININSNLMESKSFDNFVEGDCNRLARSAGYAVANNPGKTAFNPLLLYCSSGLGKTHLCHAIGIQIKNNFPDKIVLYVPCNVFINQYIDSVRNNTVNDFIHFYQMIDVLIIDDIHELAGKDSTQNAFFHIFNFLHQKGNQIVITSDKAPVDMKGMEPRLLSRFKWGLSADLQTPDFETRVAIIDKKLYNDGVEMPRDVIEYLAYSITTNVRELEGALISLLAQSSLNKKPINLELAKQIIDKFVKTNTREISIDYIQKIVCDYFDISIDILNSKTRKREIVQARQLSMFFSKKLTKSSLAAIGLHCGNKDHATVLHACRTVNNLIETDKQFKVYVDDIEKKIKL
jgi:chromosomal replication initiator protein